MRPNFALTLTFETIGLLRRTARGWMPVGEVPTDSPDLDDMLSYLRSKALGLSPQGFTTKLVLPDSKSSIPMSPWTVRVTNVTPRYAVRWTG